VEPKVIQLEQNRIDLVFEINEGEWTEVRNIRFIGNKKYSDARLRKTIRTRESRWYRYFSSDDNYDPDRLNLDRDLLRRFYLSNGFADFRILSSVAELTPDRKNFFITFMVEEGPRYAVGKVDLDIRLEDLKADSISESIRISEGDWYDAERVENTIAKLTDDVGAIGFAFVDIRPQVKRNRENNTINVTFEVNEGPRLFVERIEVLGNVRTSDEVVRREFRIVEGDAFNSSKLRRSKKRMEDLDYFEKVTLEQIPGTGPDKTVITVGVEEKSTGALTLGFGFSTADGPVADIGLSERNLMGNGHHLSLSGKLSGSSSKVDLSFTEPYFLDRDIAAGFDLFHAAKDNQDASSYSMQQTGGTVRSSYPITENLRQSWSHSVRQVKIEDVSVNASKLVRDASGDELVSILTHGESYDKRDSKTMPTEGYMLSMTNSLAGIGGTKRFFRNKIRGKKYFPLYDQVIFTIGGGIGHILGIGEDVNLHDRFTLGGDNLRGFQTSGVGPRDRSTKDALGGEWLYYASSQVKFPLGLPEELGLSGKIFTDLGSTGQLSTGSTSVNDKSSLRLSVGSGLDWASPFGPIGIDYGFPILKESFDQTESIRVNFGTRF
jgi:outer membrane protein insertion porin family